MRIQVFFETCEMRDESYLSGLLRSYFSISERLDQCNGSLKVESGLAGGTRVVLTVPLKNKKDNDLRDS